MIGKKIKAKMETVSKAARVEGLANYLAAGQANALRADGLTNYISSRENEIGRSKCVLFGARGFQSDDFETQKREMTWGAEMAPRSADPVEHCVFSWPEQERPSQAQFEQAVGVIVDHLGLDGHQLFWAVHDDTDNLHLHLVFNRVNPETGLVRRINGGWDHDAILQAVALVERAQGWTPEPNARWVVKDGQLALTQTARRERQIPGVIQAKATSEDLAKIAVAAAKRSRNWEEFHAFLAKKGAAYDCKGSGARLVLGEVDEKASGVDRGLSLAALEARWGQFVALVPFSGATKVPGRIQDQEHRRGEESRARMAQKALQQALRTAKTWPTFHAALAKHGVAFDRKGSGAVFVVGDTTVKASAVNRSASLDALEKYLGAFKERPADLLIERMESKTKGSVKLFQEFSREKEKSQAAASEVKKAIREAHGKALRELRESQRQARREALAGDWRGRGRERNARASLIAAKQAAEKAQLRDMQKKERKELLDGLPRQVDYVTWLKQRGDRTGAIDYRLGGDLRLLAAEARDFASVQGEESSRAIHAPQDIRSFVGWVEGGVVQYARDGEGVAFEDRGREIRVRAQERDEALDADAIRAALQLALAKWGKVKVDGNAEYMRICTQLMEEEGVTLSGLPARRLEKPEATQAVAVPTLNTDISLPPKARNERIAEAKAALQKREPDLEDDYIEDIAVALVEAEDKGEPLDDAEVKRRICSAFDEQDERMNDHENGR